MPRPALSDEQLLARINKLGPIPSHMPGRGHCWVWSGSIQPSNGGDYGRIYRNGTAVSAHKWMWQRFMGPLPEGKTLDHLCRNTLCVNPDHLEPVTMRENILRGTNPAAVQAQMTHCKAGHPLSGENFRIAKNGQRMCRECRRRWERERKARLKAARPDRRNGSKTHCKYGHPFDSENTYVGSNGARKCRTCGRQTALARYRASR